MRVLSIFVLLLVTIEARYTPNNLTVIAQTASGVPYANLTIKISDALGHRFQQVTNENGTTIFADLLWVSYLCGYRDFQPVPQYYFNPGAYVVTYYKFETVVDSSEVELVVPLGDPVNITFVGTPF